MNKKKMFWIIKGAAFAAMLIAGIALYDQLPQQLPMHRNFKGEVDSTMDKMYGLWIIPAITLAIMILMPVFAKIDPRKEKYKKFEGVWEIFQLVLVLFFAYIYFVTLYITLNPAKSITAFMLLGLGTLFIILGNYMGKLRSNFFVGIKTPWTLSDEDVWNKTHRFGGAMFVLGGFAFIFNAFFQIYMLYVLIAVVLMVSVVPILYSYILYKQKNKK